MIYGLAECDGLPIEVGSIAGRAVAIRMEFTNDVAELETARDGVWTPVGRLRLGADGVIALDKKHQHVEGWSHEVPLPAGWYAAGVFVTGDDHVGIRLRADDALRPCSERDASRSPALVRDQPFSRPARNLIASPRSRSRRPARLTCH